MTKKHFLLTLALATMLPLQQLQAEPIILNLQVRIEDPINNDGGHRTPVLPPVIGIEDYTLYFNTPCDGCELRVVDGDGVVVYSTIIPISSSSLDLPSSLSGNYELQIISGNYCFYTEILL